MKFTTKVIARCWGRNTNNPNRRLSAVVLVLHLCRHDENNVPLVMETEHKSVLQRHAWRKPVPLREVLDNLGA